MDKNAIKRYAVWARRELIDRVSKRAAIFGVTADSFGDPNADSVNGHLLSGTERRQRQALIRRIEEKGYEQVMEEVAYTWFNRFAALRFMEVNGYLPSHVRVFTNDAGEFKPQILSEVIHLDLIGLNMEKVYQLKDANQEEELFKYLLIVQCNALYGILPGMFQKIDDYTELLLPDYLLREGSAIEQMVSLIPEDDWKDQVQIIGWLYQYYNTEPKDKVFADLKKNIKISKQNIPAATQLFTPDWIVHYMVENSLGRLWVEGHPSARKYLPDHNEDGSVHVEEGKWNYYLEEAEQEPEVQAQLDEIRKQYATLKPEEILTIDPCAGSGHILCVLFDVLVNIYEDYGYTAREAAVSIVQNNLWGLDIDDRAAQLAYFAVMMKARQYDRRFFTREIQPHVYAIQESNGIDRNHLNYLGRGLSDLERNNAVTQMHSLLDEFVDAKEYGSILQPKEYDWELLRRFVEDTTTGQQMSFEEAGLDMTQGLLQEMIAQGQALAHKYHAIVTNPPYMVSGSMDDKLLCYIKKQYSRGKNDLYSVFIERCICFARSFYYVGMITQHSWMFLSRFEQLRTNLLNFDTVNMLHLGARAFEEIGGEIVQTTTFIKRNSCITDYIGTYCRLIDENSQEKKETVFLHGDNRYYSSQQIFTNIYGSPVAYWISRSMMDDFLKKELADYGETRQGFATGDNSRFLRFWYEVDFSKVAFGCIDAESFWKTNARYAPCNKGGEARKWYGNNYIVCKYDQASYKSLLGMGNHLPSRDYYFRKGLTWSTLGTSFLSMRFSPTGFLFETKGSMYFPFEEQHLHYLLGVMNSKVAMVALQVLCPTIDFHEGPVSHVPILFGDEDKIDRLVEENIELAKNDWDSFELSWDFKRHPLAKGKTIQSAFEMWENECLKRFDLVKYNEEEINRTLIKIYNLDQEITPVVDDKEITICKSDRVREIKSLISYAVGCMFGRYSLDQSGIAFAGGVWDNNVISSFQVDTDGILPICDDEYFNDDIVNRFVDFIKALYGDDTLEENLKYIADTLSTKGSPREIIRNYFLNDFYADHLKTYQKTPIYWLFDSGKKNGFKCLVYIHRYKEDTIARIRIDYLHELQARYRTSIETLYQQFNKANVSDRVRISKKLNAIKEQAEEARIYEEKIHHIADRMIGIDLDNGIKQNYEMFSEVLAKIK